MIKKVVNNASWIVGCKIVQAILSLIISMFTARYLGPSNYGAINYAASIVAFVVPIMQLGFRNTLVQNIIANENEEGKVVGTSIILNIFSAILCIIGVNAFSIITNRNEIDLIIVCFLYSLNLLFQALEMIQYWFQAKLLSKYTSIISLCAYFIVSMYKVYLLVTSKSVYWFAISQALDYLLISVLLFVIYNKIGNQKLSFCKKTAKQMLNVSKYYIVSSMMVTVFTHIDSVMLKFMLGKEAVGFYSAAVSCAGMTNFIFAAIIDSARPTIFDAYKKDKEVFEKYMSNLYTIIIYLSLMQSAAITIFSKVIIKILYGQMYLESIGILRIIIWYTTFSYIGSVRNIWILSEQKQKYLWIINLSGALSNIVLNYILIKLYGIPGAAIASVLTQFFTNAILGFIIKPIRTNNKIMLKGANPMQLKTLTKVGLSLLQSK